MLNNLRSAVKSPPILILIALLVLSFAVWGVNDVFTGRAGTSVARIGDQRVSEADLRRAWDAEVRRIQQETRGALTADEARSLGLDRQVLNGLIQGAMLDAKASEMGLYVAPEEVAETLAAEPAFIDGVTGEFSREAYIGALQRARLTVNEYEDLLRDDLNRARVVNAFAGGVAAPDVLASVRARFLNEARSFSIVAISPDAAGTIADPTDDEVQAFYDANAARFEEPERRAVTFFKLDLADMAVDIRPDPDQVRALFEAREASLSSPERRALVQLTATDEATATTIAERLRAGDEPSAIASDLGLSAPLERPNAAQSDILDDAAAAAAFAAEADTVTDPTLGSLGAWVVWRVGSVTPARAADFDAIRMVLEQEIRDEDAASALFESASAFDDARRTGASLEEAARTAGAAAFSYWPVDAQGFDQDGERVDVLADRPEMLTAAFDAVVGETSRLLEIGEDGFFALRVDAVVEPATAPLARVRAEIVAELTARAEAGALTAIAQTAEAALNDGAIARVAAEQAGSGARADALTVTRASIPTGAVRPTLVRAFSANLGDVIVGQGADGGLAVLRVDRITAADTAISAQADDTLNAAVQNDVSAAVLSSLQAEYAPTINEALVARATGATQ